MLIIWQCSNIHKISASQLRNSHNNTVGQIFLCTCFNIYARVPVATGDNLLCRAGHSSTNKTAGLLLVQNPIISKNRFYSPSILFGQEGAVDATVLCILWKNLRNIFKKPQLLSYYNKLQRTADTQTSHMVMEGRDTFRKQWNNLRPELFFEDVWLP